MRKMILFKMVLSIALLALILGCATTSGIKESATTDSLAVITDIKVEDNRLVITSDKHFTYTIYSANDPYRSTIEIPDMRIGNFMNKIVSDKAGITEVLPSQVNIPKPTAKIDIVLHNPSVIEPAYKDNTLILTVKADEPVITSSAKDSARTVQQPLKAEPSVKNNEAQKTEINITPMSKATEIKNIEIRKAAGGAKVLISGNGTMTPNVFPIDDRIVVDIPDVSLNTAMPSSVVSPLKGIRAGKHKEKVRLVLDLQEKTNYDVAAIGSSIEISLQKTAAPEQPQIAKSNDSEKGAAAPETEKIVEGTFSGKRISLDFQDADIIPIFRLLADISGYNIVVSPGISGKITLKLINVPWDQALDIILRTFSLSKMVDGNIMRIVPTASVAREMDEVTKAKKAASEAGELRTKVFPVNYADLTKLKDAIDKAKVVSSRGSITLDERGSSLIINDLDDNLEKIGALISELDQESMQARQVMIEAKIVEATSDFTKDIGVQWGTFFKNPPTTGDNNFILGRTSTQTTGPGTFLVNLPAAVGAGSGGQIGFGFINKAGTFSLDLQLSAMEQLKKGKVLSNPKVMTMNNQEAKITQGKTIYLGVATADKIDYKAIDALLSLTVKPRIAPGGAIFMDLDITKDEPGTVTSGGVDILKNTVKTTVLINDAETVVIGGIFKQTQTDIDDEVPGLGKIPILGLLFKKNKTVTSNTEVMIFITPKIVEFSSMR